MHFFSNSPCPSNVLEGKNQNRQWIFLSCVIIYVVKIENTLKYNLGCDSEKMDKLEIKKLFCAVSSAFNYSCDFTSWGSRFYQCDRTHMSIMTSFFIMTAYITLTRV